DRDPAIPAHLLNILHSVGGLNSVRVLHPMSHGPEPLMREYAPGPVAGQVVSRIANGDGSRRPQHLTTSRGAASIASKPENGNLPPITNGNYDPTDIYSSEAYDANALYAQGHCCNPLANPVVAPKETTIDIATSGSKAFADTNG